MVCEFFIFELVLDRLSVAVLHICQVDEKLQEAVVEEKPHEKAVPFWFVSFSSLSWF